MNAQAMFDAIDAPPNREDSNALADKVFLPQSQSHGKRTFFTATDTYWTFLETQLLPDIGHKGPNARCH